MPHYDIPKHWRKSSYSGSGPDSNCVEVAHTNNLIAIRDSTQTTGDYPSLAVSQTDWAILLTQAHTR